MSDNTTPEWYDETKLIKALYQPGERGWVIDLGDGTCRLVNTPVTFEGENPPKWGERYCLIKHADDRGAEVAFHLKFEGEENG